MRPHPVRLPTAAAAPLPVLVLFAVAAARPAAAQSPERFTLRGRDVAVFDPAGRVQVVAGSGSDVTVEVTRGGRDAGRLRVLTDDVDGRPTLRVVAPEDELVYPAMGRYSNATIRVRDDGTWGGGDGDGWGGRGRKLEIRGSGSGAEAWADLVVRVPAGSQLALQVAAGSATAQNVSADLKLGTAVAALTVSGTRGNLSVGAGSGRIDLRDVQGDEVRVGTGSGGARVDGVKADRLTVGSGSGGVEGGGIDAGEARFGTGSGGMRLGLVRARRLQVGAGSGSVELELGAGLEDARIGTGSGGITLRVPPALGATFEVSTGSGGVSTDVPVQVVRQERNRFEGRVGDGSARVRVSAGSGSVRLVPAR